MLRSSQAAINLIVESEVSSKALYEKLYARPEWPAGGNSGITVGIGYDLGYSTAQQIMLDFKDYLTPDVVRAMQRYAGLTGAAAHAKLAEARQSIYVPWDVAMSVFMKHDMPKWEAMVLKACPGSEHLPGGCFGVLTGLAYNRGASFSKAGDRYAEMRSIRTHVATNNFDKVPGDIRSMKRLWTKPSERGLLTRREKEAQLWEQSLAAAPQTFVEDNSLRVDTGDDKDVTLTGNEDTSTADDLNVQPQTGAYSVEVELLQHKLVGLGYHEVGDTDGFFGGKFVAGASAFMSDRGKDPNRGQVTQALKDEITKALTEHLPDGKPWSRPIAPSRANATAKDIAGKVESVNQTWYTKLYAYLAGIPAAAVALFKSIFGDYNDPTSYIYSVKSFFAAIPSEYYFLAIAGVAGLILYQATKAQNATVKDYQQGKIN